MPVFYIADVRKRLNSESSMPQQPAAQRCEVAVEVTGSNGLADAFGGQEESSDDPVACRFAGCEGITMEWGAGTSAGQIDFYGAAAEQDEPERFLSLYILSGKNQQEDRQAIKQLEQYADFRHCTEFPLVLHVTSDPLTAPWQQRALDAVRQGIPAVVGAFLKARFSAAAV